MENAASRGSLLTIDLDADSFTYTPAQLKDWQAPTSNPASQNFLSLLSNSHKPIEASTKLITNSLPTLEDVVSQEKRPQNQHLELEIRRRMEMSLSNEGKLFEKDSILFASSNNRETENMRKGKTTTLLKHNFTYKSSRKGQIPDRVNNGSAAQRTDHHAKKIIELDNYNLTRKETDTQARVKREASAKNIALQGPLFDSMEPTPVNNLMPKSTLRPQSPWVSSYDLSANPKAHKRSPTEPTRVPGLPGSEKAETSGAQSPFKDLFKSSASKAREQPSDSKLLPSPSHDLWGRLLCSPDLASRVMTSVPRSSEKALSQTKSIVLQRLKLKADNLTKIGRDSIAANQISKDKALPARESTAKPFLEHRKYINPLKTENNLKSLGPRLAISGHQPDLRRSDNLFLQHSPMKKLGDPRSKGQEDSARRWQNTRLLNSYTCEDLAALGKPSATFGASLLGKYSKTLKSSFDETPSPVCLLQSDSFDSRPFTRPTNSLEQFEDLQK